MQYLKCYYNIITKCSPSATDLTRNINLGITNFMFCYVNVNWLYPQFFRDILICLFKHHWDCKQILSFADLVAVITLCTRMLSEITKYFSVYNQL